MPPVPNKACVPHSLIPYINRAISPSNNHLPIITISKRRNIRESMKGTYSDPIVIGSAPSPPPPVGSRLMISQQGSPGFADNENSEKEDSITSKSMSTSSSHSGSPSSNAFMEQLIGSQVDLIPRPLTSGKKILASKELSSSWDGNPSTATSPLIGIQSGTMLNLETSWPSPQMCEYVIIVRSKALRQTIFTRLQLFEPQLFIGAHLELAKLVELGKKPVWRLILKIPGPNGILNVNSRFDGYVDQSSVILDEFRGTIDISHLLRWLDRYPVLVEGKGTTRPFLADKIWITSNLPPLKWYPDLDELTMAALLRRLTVVEEMT